MLSSTCCHVGPRMTTLRDEGDACPSRSRGNSMAEFSASRPPTLALHMSTLSRHVWNCSIAAPPPLHPSYPSLPLLPYPDPYLSVFALRARNAAQLQLINSNQVSCLSEAHVAKHEAPDARPSCMTRGGGLERRRGLVPDADESSGGGPVGERHLVGELAVLLGASLGVTRRDLFREGCRLPEATVVYHIVCMNMI